MAFNAGRMKLELRRARASFAWLVFAGLAAAIALYFTFSNLTFERPFDDRYKVDVAFESAKGVFPGTHPVRIAGVKVGVVSDVRVEDGEAVATLSIEGEYAPLYRDAKVRIRPQTPLEDVYVSIEDRGTPEAGELQPDDPPLPSENTESEVQISRVLQTFEPGVRKRLAVLLDQMGRGLEDRGAELKRAFAKVAPFLHQAERVSEVLGARERQLRRIVANFGDLADVLARRDKQLNELVAEGSATLGALAEADRELRDTIGALPGTMSAARSSFASLRATEEKLAPALQALQPAAAELEGGLEGLERFALDATPALSELLDPARELRGTARALRPASIRLRRALHQLRPQAPRADQLTVSAAECVEEVSLFFQDTLSVFKFGNKLGPFPRGSQSGYGVAITDTPIAAPQPTVTKVPMCYEGAR